MTPRAPLQLPGSPGYHWYLVPRVGYPDPETFAAAREALAELHDELWEETGIGPGRTVLGGFSMGAVMSYATALSADRPSVAGILAFSGFVPTVEGWEPALDDRTETRVFISHGRSDPVIGIEFAERAEGCSPRRPRRHLPRVELGHQIDPAHLREAAAGLVTCLGSAVMAASGGGVARWSQTVTVEGPQQPTRFAGISPSHLTPMPKLSLMTPMWRKLRARAEERW